MEEALYETAGAKDSGPVQGRATHMLAAHTLSAGQVLPQAPQLAGSVVVSTHAPLQSVAPPLHGATHDPPCMTSPTGQLPPEPLLLLLVLLVLLVVLVLLLLLLEPLAEPPLPSP